MKVYLEHPVALFFYREGAKTMKKAYKTSRTLRPRGKHWHAFRAGPHQTLFSIFACRGPN